MLRGPARSRPAWLPALAGLLTLVPAAALGPSPGVARADGDPASDVLLGESVFYPYTPPVTASTQRRLGQLTMRAARAGFPLKVALIDSPVDLGVIPDLFGRPSAYARFLDQEISYRRPQPLLVVMPSGFGADGVSPQARTALATIPRPRGTRSEDLALAAIPAVRALAAASGHSLGARGASDAGTAGSRGSPALLWVLIAAAAAVGGVLLGVGLRRRRRGARAPGPASEPPAKPREGPGQP